MDVFAGCGRDQFQCANGDCIRADQQCNNFIDCADGSDENCGKVSMLFLAKKKTRMGTMQVRFTIFLGHSLKNRAPVCSLLVKNSHESIVCVYRSGVK